MTLPDPFRCLDCQAPTVAVEARVHAPSVNLTLHAQCGHLVSPPRARELWRRGLRWTLPAVTGAALIDAERTRQQTEEGYTTEHDAQHENDLAWAAWCYIDRAASEGADPAQPPSMWPWGPEAWKGEHSPMRMLTVAGALIAAEIDRLLVVERTRGADQARPSASDQGAGVER